MGNDGAKAPFLIPQSVIQAGEHSLDIVGVLPDYRQGRRIP
jgi:hypothetical protein